MKQTLEEAAKDELLHSYSNKYNGNGAFEYGQQAMLNMFFKGAEWQAKQSPWINIEDIFPNDFKQKLILLKNGQVRIAYLDCIDNSDTVVYFWCDEESNKTFSLKNVVAYMPIPSFDEILKENRDVLERIKEKGD